ncbi:MAG: GNAT family N-acetyltransferase [Chloroflexi bacterium]|nr:GNAT family N-acetyltransferase [Chloroflexota bacterium]
MTTSRLDLSQGDIPAQIQANLIAYMRLFAGLPGVVTHDSDDLYWIISHKPAPGNVILRARWSEAEAEQRIDDLFAEIGQHLDQIDWLVYPGDQPSDLGKRLGARGMPGGRAGNWLWMRLKEDAPPPLTPSRPTSSDMQGERPNKLGGGGTKAKLSGVEGFHIEQVRDDAMMLEWLHATEAGFGGEESIFYDAYARHGYGDDAFSLHYIGYVDDTAVTSATLLDAGGCAAIYDVSTPPEYRGRGFGGAITHALMGEIQRRGYAESWIWSSDMAQSVYRKLGYVDADFGVCEHTWKNK